MTPESSNNMDLIKSQLGLGSIGNLRNLQNLNKAAKGLGDSKSVGNAKGAGDAKQTGAAGAVTDAQKKRWKASLDFEAMFLSNMYKSMRQSTIGEGDELTKASPGREIFTEMLDNQYASLHSKSKLESGEQGMKNAVNGVSNSMASQIYRALARREEGKDPAANKDLPVSAGQKNAGIDDVEDAFSTTPGLVHSVGRQARTGNVTSAQSTPAISGDALNSIVDLASKTYGVDSSLIKSVIKTESANHPMAVSDAGAKGLMQLMDSTAKDMGVTNSFNAHENVLAGTRYLKQLLQRFDGNQEKALAAYNAGPATVERFGGVPPYAETQDYVKRVLQNKSKLDASEAEVSASETEVSASETGN
jgi:Rod binding domain-containing protein